MTLKEYSRLPLHGELESYRIFLSKNKILITRTLALQKHPPHQNGENEIWHRSYVFGLFFLPFLTRSCVKPPSPSHTNTDCRVDLNDSASACENIGRRQGVYSKRQRVCVCVCVCVCKMTHRKSKATH